MGPISKNYLRPFSLRKTGLYLLIVISILGTGLYTPYTVLARPLMAATPNISLEVPSQVMIGEDFSFIVNFSNSGDAPGYGPFIDVVFPVNGADGAAGTETPDGISFDSSFGPTYGGVELTCESFTFDSNGEVVHPFYRNTAGEYHIIEGTTGDTFVSCILPFGSFVPEQPQAPVTFHASLSDLADAGVSLSIRARGGFMFGGDPLDNWCCDVIAPSPNSNNSADWNGPSRADVTPTILTLTKEYSGPEDETATGPNYQRTFTITVDIAEGQTVNNLDVSDLLPNNMQFVGNVVTQIQGVPAGASDINTPSTATPGGTLTRRFASVLGTAAVNDVTMAFDFFIPLEDTVPARVIDPDTGDDVLSPNEASALGDWVPIDGRDTGGTDNVSAGVPGPEYTLTDKSIAIQKGHTNTTDAVNSPEDVIEYTLNIQISDYFAFEDLVVTDVISDGQHVDPSFTPQIEVEGNDGYFLSTANMTGGNYDITCNYSGTQGSECTASDPAADNGETTLVFRISDELVDRGRANGKLLGGCVPVGGGIPDCNVHNDGATIVTITYRAVILQDFVDDYPSNDSSVDQGDVFSNNVEIKGTVLDNPTLTPGSFDEVDTSDEGLSIGRDELEKFIYAINGDTSYSTPVHIRPQDEITFQLKYDLVTSDVEDLYITDYLPLPVLDVDDFDADGTGGDNWDWTTGTDGKCANLVSGEFISGFPTVPTSGVVCLGSSDTFSDYSGIIPSLTNDIPANSLEFYYGDYDNTQDLASTIDILFTISVNNEPYADGLYFTNQSEIHEGSTNAGDQDTNTIVSFILDEPYLVLDKGAIASDNGNAIFTPSVTGPVVFSSPGSANPRWSGTISSDDLASTPISSAVSNVDAGDLVSFALVIENQGNSSNGAFDIRISDVIPPGFMIPGGGSGLNLAVYHGDGSGPVPYTGLGGGPDSTDGTPDDLFGNGLEITDPGTGIGACQKYHPTAGTNLILIIYDLEVEADIDPGVELENLSTVFNYANTESGPDFTGDDADLDASTTTLIAVPVVNKSLLDTQIDEINNNDVQAVIGETIQYTLELTIPEGEMQLTQLIDELDEGLRFVSLDSVTASSGDLNSSQDTSGSGDFSNTSDFDPALSGTGASADPQTLTFDFGTLVNANRDNTTPETLTLTYTVLVLNDDSNQQDVLLDNSAYLDWDEDGDVNTTDDRHQSTPDSAEQVTVVEPQINVSKSVVIDGSGNSGDAGDSVVYTITFTSVTGQPTAYEADLSDFLSADIDFTSGSYGITNVTDTEGILVPGSVEITGSNELRFLNDVPIDMVPGRVVTISLTGELKITVYTGQDIDNDAVISWTSMDGDQNPGAEEGERTGEDGSGGLNDYVSTGSAVINIIDPSPAKSVITTSEDHTGTISGVPRLVIGEIVRYRLEVRLAEGTSNDLILRDNLPAGLVFLDDGTTKVVFVATTGTNIDSQETADSDALAIDDGSAFVNGDETTLAGITPTYVLPAQNISSTLTGNNDIYSSGTDVYFKLGDVFNSETDLNSEFAVIEFNALVANVSGNQSGTILPNTFSVFVDEDGDENAESGEIVEISSSVDVIVAEPDLSVTKTLSTVPSDAGDAVGYTLVIENNETGDNDGTAFELRLTDTFNPYLNSLSIDSITITQGGTCTGNGAGTTDYSDDGGSFSGQDLTFNAACLDPGETITLVISAVLADDVPAGYNLQNTADLDWTSLPGEKGTAPNPTGSDVDDGSTTEDDSGGSRGERNGSETPAVNDYTATDDANHTLDVPTPVKSIVSTDQTHTSESGDGSAGNPRDLTIGEIIRYRLTITLPEGINTNVSLEDTLPTGFSYVGDSTVQISFIADLDITEAGDLFGADNDALPPTFTLPINRISVSGQVVTFTLDTLENNDINDGNTEYAVIDFDVLVNNDANNNNTDLDNNGFVVFLDSSSVGTSNQVQTRIVEPQLNIEKLASNIEPTYGETFDYILTISHLGTSASEAFDIVVIDTIPAGLTYVGGSAGPAGWSPSYDGTNTLTWTCSAPCSLPLASSANLTYDVTMEDAPAPPTPGDVFSNTTSMAWTSLDDTDINERTGDDNGGTEPQNDYTDNTTEDVTLTNPDLRVTKDDGVAFYVPGLTVVYDIVVENVGNEDVNAALVEDAIPPQLSSWDWVCNGTTGGASGCDGVSGSTANFNDSVNLPAGSSITYQVTANILSSATGDMTNTVTVTLPAEYIEPTPDDNTDSDTDGQDSQADLSVDKDDGVTLISPGTTITYTIVVSNFSPSDVWGAEVTDTIQTKIDSWTWACTGTTGGASGCTPAPSSALDFSDIVDLPANSSITYTVTAQVSNTASGTLTNEVTVTAPAGVTETDLNNNTDDDTDGFPTSTKDLDGSLHGVTTLPDVAIGEVLTYEVVLTVPVGSMTNLHLIDTLDRGLAFVSCDVITGPDLTTNVPGGFSQVCANPTVSTYPSGSTDDEDLGRQVDFNFGTLANNSGRTANLTVQYEVVVLDSLGNQSGSTSPLNNQAEWTWKSGQLSDQAVRVVILEPELTITKDVDSFVAYPGQLLTFTLIIDHSGISETSAYDLELMDIIPDGLIYQPPIRHVGGQAPDQIIDAGAPTLIIRWFEFENLGVNSVIEIDVLLDSDFRRSKHNQSITNDVSLSWTSLPGDFSAAQSVHNPLSTERYYDPLSNVNIYNTGDSTRIRIPALPDTGFAPGKVTSLPIQSENQTYGDLDGLQVEIPKLGLSVPIVSIPQSDQGWDLSWLWNQAGWLEGTAYPSWYGNTVITGHAYLSNGLPGPFVDLGTLSWGDEIFLYAHGLKYTYQVRVRELVSADDLSILEHMDQDWLTLFTCKEYSETLDEYLWRQVVQAVLIDVEQLD